MAQDKKLYGLIDGPEPFDTLETWERHLRRVEALPADDMAKPLLVSQARAVVAQMRSGGKDKGSQAAE